MTQIAYLFEHAYDENDLYWILIHPLQSNKIGAAPPAPGSAYPFRWSDSISLRCKPRGADLGMSDCAGC